MAALAARAAHVRRRAVVHLEPPQLRKAALAPGVGAVELRGGAGRGGGVGRLWVKWGFEGGGGE